MTLEATYRFWVITGAIVGVLVATVLASRRVPGVERERLLLLFCITATAMLVGARIYAFVENGFTLTPAGGGWSQGGQRQPGAVLAGLVVFPLLARRMLRPVPALRVMDAAAPGFAMALGFVRIGCLTAGCCYGTLSSLPWAIRYGTNSPAWVNHVARGLISSTAVASLLVHPLPVYFGLLAIVTCIGMYAYFPHRRFDGEVVLLGTGVLEAGKAFLESFRQLEGSESGPTILQLVSVGVAVVCAAMLLASRMAPGVFVTSVAAPTSRK